jgi:hypothetical protein
VKLELPNDPIDFFAGLAEIQENYNPALGFVNRSGIRVYEIGGRYRFRPGGLARMVDVGAGLEVITDDIHNDLETVGAKGDLFKIVTRADDSIKLTYRWDYEHFEEDEKIVGRIHVPAGTYGANGLIAGIETSEARPVKVGVEVGYGGFLHGTRLQIKPTIDWHPTPHWYLSGRYEENRIRTPTGDLDVRVVQARVVYHFNPDLSIDTLLQYDNLSTELGINSRFRWTIAEGNDLYFIVNTLFDEDKHLGVMQHNQSEALAKVAWTFRF